MSLTVEREYLEEIFKISRESTYLGMDHVTKHYADVLLALGRYDTLSKIDPSMGKRSDLKKVVQFFPETNWTRLLLLRIKKFEDSVVKLAKVNGLKYDTALKYVNRVFKYAGILWFTPRFIYNSALIMKHMITDKGNRLDYFRKVWSAWGNDGVWANSQVFSLLVSRKILFASAAAALGPGCIYVTVGAYGFDVINSIMKSITRIQKINRVIDIQREHVSEYMASAFRINMATLNYHEVSSKTSVQEMRLLLGINGNHSLEELNALRMSLVYLNALEDRRKFYITQCMYGIAIAVSLAAGMAVACLCPLALVLGNLLVLATCMSQYYIKNVHMPKQQIQLSREPDVILYRRLHDYLDNESDRLKKRMESVEGGSLEFDRILLKWSSIKILTRQIASGAAKSHIPVGGAVALLKECKKYSIMSEGATKPDNDDSIRALKKLLAPFKTDYKSFNDKQTEIEIKNEIDSFKNEVKAGPILPRRLLTEDDLADSRSRPMAHEPGRRMTL